MRSKFFVPMVVASCISIAERSSGNVPGLLIGDYNGDGMVEAADYPVWRNNLGTVVSMLNRDPANTGALSQADYQSWKANFGNFGGSAAVIAPEPAGLTLVGIALVMIASWRRTFRRAPPGIRPRVPARRTV